VGRFDIDLKWLIKGKPGINPTCLPNYPVSQTAAACDGAIKVVGVAPVWQD